MQGIRRVLEILEAVAANQPVGVGELSRVVALPKSSVQRHLVALADAGWIRQVGGEPTKWTLTARALVLGQKGSPEGGLREAALEPMRALRDSTQETITMQVPISRSEMVQIERVDSEQAVRTYVPLGQVHPMHSTSGGLAFLAACDDPTVEEILGGELTRLTGTTVVDPDRLRKMIKNIRVHGYAVNDVGMNRVGVCAVGAAICSRTGEPVAAIGVSIPESRFSAGRVPGIATALVKAAQNIEGRI